MSASKAYFVLIVTLISMCQACATVETNPSGLPAGFVYLASVDPSIIQSTRYFGSENFLSRRVPGYVSQSIICTSETARALSLVQKEFASKGYSLVVYDAYRPQRAVDEFMRWSTDAADQTAKAKYYPTIDKKDVFKLGYVAEKSGHSRGSTVDLTLIKIAEQVKPVEVSTRPLTDGSVVPFLDDNTLDMGTSFDLFHPSSHHDTALVEGQHAERRNLLRSVMKAHGFKEYAEEWWHYTLASEPFPNTYFDFVPSQLIEE